MAIASPGIIKAANDALVAVRPAINVVKQFAYDMSDEFATPGDTVKVPVAATGTLTAFNTSSNNFETEDGTLSWEQVKLDKTVKATFKISAQNMLDMPMASYWETIAKASANAVNKFISDQIGALFVKADLKATELVKTGDLSAKAAAKLRASCKGRVDETVLLVKPDWYADILGDLDSSTFGGTDPIRMGKVDRLFGFASVVEARDLPTGVNGVLLPKDCLVIASRAFAVADESVYSEYGTAKDEETGFALTAMRHGAPATGGAFLNVAALFGLKLIQTSKIVNIVAAATT